MNTFRLHDICVRYAFARLFIHYCCRSIQDPTYSSSSTALSSPRVIATHVAPPRPVLDRVIILFSADLPAIPRSRLQRALLLLMSIPDCCHQLSRLPGRSCTARCHWYLPQAQAAANSTSTRPPTTFFQPLPIPNTSLVLPAGSLVPSFPTVVSWAYLVKVTLP